MSWNFLIIQIHMYICTPYITAQKRTSTCSIPLCFLQSTHLTEDCTSTAFGAEWIFYSHETIHFHLKTMQMRVQYQAFFLWHCRYRSPSRGAFEGGGNSLDVVSWLSLSLASVEKQTSLSEAALQELCRKDKKKSCSHLEKCRGSWTRLWALLSFHCCLFGLQPFHSWQAVFTWNSQKHSCEYQQKKEAVVWERPLIC